MKSSLLNLMSLKLTLLSFMFTGMFLFGSSQIHAQDQVNSANSFTAPKLTYVSPGTAISRVEEKVNAHKLQLSNFTPGSQSFNVSEAKLFFYSTILEKLNAGKTVKESLQAGLQLIPNTDSISALSLNEQLALKQEAINLLKA